MRYSLIQSQVLHPCLDDWYHLSTCAQARPGLTLCGSNLLLPRALASHPNLISVEETLQVQICPSSQVRQHDHQSLATVQPTLQGAWAPRNCPQNAPTLQGCPHLLKHGDDQFRIVLSAAYRASSSGQSTGKYPASPCTSPISSHNYFH